MSGESKPKRIQRKRTKGWRMPDNCVYVGRPSKWGNPFGYRWCRMAFDALGATDECKHRLLVEFYRMWVNGILVCNRSRIPVPSQSDLEELRGKDLCCWCPLDKACHADVLLELSNR